MLSADERLWLRLAVQLGFLTDDAVERVLADTAAKDAASPLALRFVNRGLVSEADLEALAALATRTSRVHGDASAALAFVTTHTPAPTAPWLTGGETVKSGEHPRPIDSLDGLDFVVPELPGRYRQERSQELGRGGIGRVVTARDEVTGREVAMKQLLPERTADATSTVQSVTLEARFLREARLAAQLEHPAIVPVYEVGRRADGSLYYTMRRIRGRTLAEAVRAAGTLDGRLRLVSSVLAVAQALAYAHSRSVLHRDVKPQNVMLGAFGETHLLDWGLARVKGRAASKGEEPSLAPDITGGVQPGAVGTPSYMSPEQALGRLEVMDERTDVWGLGAMLYEVLTGRPPYVGPSAIDVIQQVVADDWTPVKQLVPDAPADLVAVVGKALAKDPARRYATAKDFAEDLEAWLQGRRVSARDYSSVQLAWRLLRRNPVAASLVAGLLVVLAVVGVTSWRRIQAQRDEARQFATVILGDVAPDLYDVAGAEEMLSRIATAAVHLVGEASALGIDDAHTRKLLARAWTMLGSASLNAGKPADGERFADECLRLMRLEPALVETDPQQAATTLDCLGLQLALTTFEGRAAGRRERAEAVERFLEAPRGPWPDHEQWLRAQSAALTRLNRVTLEAGDFERAGRYLARALDLDVRRSQHGASGGRPSTDLVISLRDAELYDFEAADPDKGLAHGRRALELVRRAPRRLQNTPLLRAWVAELTQHMMLLKWAGRADQVPALEAEAARVSEQLEALDGEGATTRGVLADLYVEVGRVKDAQRLLALSMAQGVRGDYLASFLLAAFLAGDDAAVLAWRDDVEASRDGQVRLVYALALARAGQPDAAAQVLRAQAHAIADARFQWPKGCMAPVVATAPAGLAPALARFSAEVEASLPGNDVPRLEAAVYALADALAPADAGTP